MHSYNHSAICSRCIMDSRISDISFDDNGVCNFCTEFLERSGRFVLNTEPENQKIAMQIIIDRIKEQGVGRDYDCVVGVSGGVDSSWVLVKAVELGLRPLAVHMDNGWNSELAQNNIHQIIDKLKVDLFTHVIDWEEYRQLMQCFFDADVIDVELLYDNAMLAVNYQQAAKFKIKSILAGTNQATEGMKFPNGWNQLKFDKKNIMGIAKKFGPVQIKTFPSIGTIDFIFHSFVQRRKWISFLDLMDFQKEEALLKLEREYGYKRYPYKHYESIFTRFYQGYILPKKFGVDKRLVHLSTLVAANQMTRSKALELIKGIAYPSERELELDKNYFLKKMNWTEDDLQEYINRKPVKHSEYPSEENLYNNFKRIYQLLNSKSTKQPIAR